VLKVRRGPFLEAGGGRKIYRVDGDVARLQQVSVGATSITEVEIVSGLSEGDTIVISDTSRFNDAQAVLLRD
jgi:HlyD family secretion protein